MQTIQSKRLWLAPLLLGPLLLLAAAKASAFGFVPTESEFHAWQPDVCRFIYAGTPVGKRQSFTYNISTDEAHRWFLHAKQNLGGAWHWCASLIYLNRAKRLPDADDKAWAIKKAVDESLFTWSRSPRDEPMRAQFGTTHAQALILAGQPPEAAKVLQEVIARYPSFGRGYSTLASLLRDEGKTDEAIKICEVGLQRSKDNSAELHYFLGTLYADQRDIDNATAHADAAYASGAALPGLRQRIKRLASTVPVTTNTNTNTNINEGLPNER